MDVREVPVEITPILWHRLCHYTENVGSVSMHLFDSPSIELAFTCLMKGANSSYSFKSAIMRINVATSESSSKAWFISFRNMCLRDAVSNALFEGKRNATIVDYLQFNFSCI
jgi:hypothetical protein